MDLTEAFAPFVVLAGHASHSHNNPHHHHLNVGLVVAHQAGLMLNLLAMICNRPNVRQGLKRHMYIPETTVFAAAEHHTSTDTLAWVYVPDTYQALALDAYESLNDAMPMISEQELRIANVRTKLPTIGRVNHPVEEARGLQVIGVRYVQEWGLAKNASFIIGRRQLTKGIDLKRRHFYTIMIGVKIKMAHC